jgi:hypothetical protein
MRLWPARPQDEPQPELRALLRKLLLPAEELSLRESLARQVAQ